MFCVQSLFVLILCVASSQSCLAQINLPKSNGEIVTHTYYTLSYLENFEQAEWVYYILTPDMLKGNVARTDNFRADPKVSSGSAQVSDYKNTGFDKGHLCPASDMRMNQLAMSETFYMSNMSPQFPAFNRGIWKKLETLIREWSGKETLHVVTGGILTKGLQKIGIDSVDVPNYFYKVVCDASNSKMIAFVLPNGKGKKILAEYAVSVDSVETLTNIDFFPQLADEIEERLESKINLSNWIFPTKKNRRK